MTRSDDPRPHPVDAFSERLATAVAARLHAPPPEPAGRPMTEAQMLRLARAAVRKIDRWGMRGVTLVSTEEITAMALTLACLGILPGPTNPTQKDPLT